MRPGHFKRRRRMKKGMGGSPRIAWKRGLELGAKLRIRRKANHCTTLANGHVSESFAKACSPSRKAEVGLGSTLHLELYTLLRGCCSLRR